MENKSLKLFTKNNFKKEIKNSFSSWIDKEDMGI